MQQSKSAAEDKLKCCSRCKEVIPESFFSKGQHRCKKCCSEYNKTRHDITGLPMLLVADIETAKMVWEHLPRPTYDGVVRIFAKCGLKVSRRTISRWRASNWKKEFIDELYQKPPPFKSAKKQLNKALPIITGDKRMTTDILMPEQFKAPDDAAPEKALPRKPLQNLPNIIVGLCKQLNDLTNEERLRMQQLEATILSIAIRRAVREQLPFLVTEKPGELGSLLKGIAATDEVSYGHENIIAAKREREMKVIDLSEPKRSPELEAELAKLGMK